jgi:hypothetical protein
LKFIQGQAATCCIIENTAAESIAAAEYIIVSSKCRRHHAQARGKVFGFVFIGAGVKNNLNTKKPTYFD